MAMDEFNSVENIINQQLNTFGIPNKKEAEKAVLNGDLIWVDSYKRKNGTIVDGYYRRK